MQLLFAKPEITADPSKEPLTFTSSKKEYAYGKVVELNITNNTNSTIVYKNNCPAEPFTVYSTSTPEMVVNTASPQIDCAKSTDPATKDIVLAPLKTTKVRYSVWSQSLFPETGRYKIGADYTLDDKNYSVISNEFEIVERGFFGNIWLSVFYQPIYNILIFFISLYPQPSLAFGIIMLTLLIRLALYIPNQKALVAQKKLAEVQPMLNKLREQYKDNQQKLAEETMKVWKTHKVNPVSSCLPILIQFPILIALFYVIQDGLNPDKTWLLYSFIQNFDLSLIHTNFLGVLELTTRNIIVLPIIVGVLQFIQMKLAMNKKPNDESMKNDPNAMVQSTMLYIMPAMIAFFTASVPAGVGLYWGTSTLFGIIQQYFVNKHVEKEIAKMKNSKQNKKKKKKDLRVIDVNPE